ncbi:MAG: hypothetical protein O3A63_08565 [Proteobacteria bacterium]|nr:hypothetical protein [Pseudomonadota bacterium]
MFRTLFSARLVLLLVLVAGCSVSPPDRPDDLCQIFDERPKWYRQALDAQDEWGLPVSVGLAFVHRESSYQAKAKPPRGTFLWVFPGRRPSSAYGYAQATDAAWQDYQKATGAWLVGRDDFGDALDFIGWYNDRSARHLRIAKTDAYHMYLAYYTGLSGYASGKWKSDAKIKGYARKVGDRTAQYQHQLERCEHKLKRSWWPF